MDAPINEFQRRALLALMDVEAGRAGTTSRERRSMKHRLFAMIRERFGCKYSVIPQDRFKEAAVLLLDEPLN